MANNTLPAEKSHSYYDYNPSVPAAGAAALIFAALLAYHIFRISRTRTWFCTPFVIGGLFEVIGFGTRIKGHYSQDVLAIFIIQYLGILLAPILFAASVYMFLGRLIRVTGGNAYSVVRVTWLTKIFVGGDILCFGIQLVGGSMLAASDNPDTSKLGKNIITMGLVLQIVIFFFFMIIAILFHTRIHRRPTTKSMAIDFPWQRFLVMLYAVSVLITFRNAFRLLEYIMGKDNYLLRNEWPVYAFDAFPMAVVLGIGGLWYVGRLPLEDGPIGLEPMRNSHSEYIRV